MKAALQAAGKKAEFKIYPAAPHSFHADYRPSYPQRRSRRRMESNDRLVQSEPGSRLTQQLGIVPTRKSVRLSSDVTRRTSMVLNTVTVWGWPAKLMHWIGALAILLLIAHGWWTTHVSAGPARHAGQRLYNLLCIAYGSDKELFADVVNQGYLPLDRADWCEDDSKSTSPTARWSRHTWTAFDERR
jgi:Putative metallopeptidase